MHRARPDPAARMPPDPEPSTAAAQLRRRRADREPKHGWTPALLIMLGVALLDWATKAMIVVLMPLGSFKVVWDDRLAFWHIHNDEMVLGLWGNLPIEMRQGIALVGAVLATIILFGVVSRGHRLLPQHRPWAWAFVGLSFGGMLGNIGERLLFWGVTDFLSFRYGSLWLPPGNIADLAIFLSFPLAVGVIVFELRARAMRGRPHTVGARRAAGGEAFAPGSR
jgi:lipoprotein signal peptidase